MRKRFSRKPPPCADLGQDDGVDPRFDQFSSRGRVTNRKALQLCEQVARTLNSLLAGECGDERLLDLLVESVQPAPDSTRLLVTVYPGPAAEAIDAGQILDGLQHAAGMLRSAIAGAIHRKRVPQLVFQVASESAGKQFRID